MSASNNNEQGKLLDNERPHTPESIQPVAAAAASPPVSNITRHRPGYARIPSVSIIDEHGTPGTTDADDITQVPRGSSGNSHGLSIAFGAGARTHSPPRTATASRARRVSIQAIPCVAVGSRSASDPATPGSTDPLISSPPSTGGFSGTTRFTDSPQEFDTAYRGAKHLAKDSVSSLQSSIQPSVYAKSDTGLVSIRSKYDDWEPTHHCQSHKRIKQKIGTWMSVIILILAVFSTFFSAAYLIIALRGPRYGRMIHTHGPLTASSAAFLTSFMAKLIELSFATVLVAFIGQALARRAFKREIARGVTLAELSMRNWIMQPGTMITHFQSVRYAGVSLLGIVSLLGALCALLYTTAATALVQPQLKWPQWRPQTMQGLVKSEFANPAYIAAKCKTPIQITYDEEYAASTCVQLEHAAMGYHNYFGYLGTWTEWINNGTGSSDAVNRPKGFALLNDNTTITAPWVEVSNMTELYQKYDVIVDNVSMAMPHPGVVQAAQDPINNIMQPQDLDGLAMYDIRASVPSPVMHVLCATMNTTQLAPFVFELWPNVSTPINMTEWPQQLDTHGYPAVYPYPYLGQTVFHEIFNWGPQYGEMKYPPLFGKLPMDYNTMINDTLDMAYGRESIYLLGKGGPMDSIGTWVEDTNYALCQMKVSQTPFCSTSYNASSSGATLEAICEDKDDDLEYIRSLKNASSGSFSINKDWPNIASEWAKSLALVDGTFDGNGSNARLLTQLILTQEKLSISLPSLAEALAVMAGCTLLSSTADTPFVEFWNYSLPSLTPGQYQYFNASVRAQQYASGGTQAYQKAFYLVLFAVFIMNCVVLLYFATHREWYTDFSEPSNLFSLAVNSPPSKELAGSCGGGPEGEHYRVSWKVNSESDHVYLESLEKDELEGSPMMRRRRRLSEGFEVMMSPVRKVSERLEKRRSG